MYSFTINVRRRHLALAVVLLLVGVWIIRTDPAGASTDPPGEGIARVYIAVGTGFPDALGVGPGAAANGAPIILVPTNPPLDPATAIELIRLDPREVIIVGGFSVVSVAMETALQDLLPNAAWARIAGTNRYKTNADFSALTFPVEGWVSVNGAAFAGLVPATDAVQYGSNYTSNSTTGSLVAAIQLPDGATIVELGADVYDSAAGETISVTLVELDGSGAFNTVASVESGGLFDDGSTTIASLAITDGLELVDNGTKSYYVFVDGSTGNPYLRTVRVRYQLGASSG